MIRSPDFQAELDELQRQIKALQARLQGSFTSGKKPGSEVEVLLVQIGDLPAALELEAVKEVVPSAALRPIPESPAWVLGTLNLRGKTTPVVHIGARLSGGTSQIRLQDLIVIAATEMSCLGFVVTSVGKIEKIRLDQEAAILDTPHAPYVVGTFTHAGEARLLLGVQELLQQPALTSILKDGAPL